MNRGLLAILASISVSQARAEDFDFDISYDLDVRALNRVFYNPRVKDVSVEEIDSLRRVSNTFFDDKDSNIDEVFKNVIAVSKYYAEDVDLKKLRTGSIDVVVNQGPSSLGLVINEEGYVLTNAHILFNDSDPFNEWSGIVVVTPDKKLFEVTKVLAIDLDHDIALLETEYKSEEFKMNSFKLSENLVIGQNYQLVGFKIYSGVELGIIKDEVVLNEEEFNPRDFYTEGIFSKFVNGVSVFNDIYVVRDSIKFNLYSQKGFSGGVFCDKFGSIYGMLLGSNGNVSTGFRIEYAQKLLDGYINHFDIKNLEEVKQEGI